MLVLKIMRHLHKIRRSVKPHHVHIGLAVSGAVIILLILIKNRKPIEAETTDCTNVINQAGTYTLTGNIANTCYIRANNVTIDGLGMYTVFRIDANGQSGDARGPAYDFTLKDLTVTGDVTGQGGDSYGSTTGEGSDATITNSTINGYINLSGSDMYYSGLNRGGSLTLSNSSVTGDITLDGGDTNDYAHVLASGGDGGTITINNSTVSGTIRANGGTGRFGTSGSGGNITINSSNFTKAYSYAAAEIEVASFGDGGNITISRSTIGDNGRVRSKGAVGGTISITDSTIGSSVLITSKDMGGADSGSLVLVDHSPSLGGTDDTTIIFTDSFNPTTGVTATDIKDGDLTSEIEITGSVEAAAGEYELVYEVTDSGTVVNFNGADQTAGPNSTSITRTITREADPDSGGGGGDPDPEPYAYPTPEPEPYAYPTPEPQTPVPTPKGVSAESKAANYQKITVDYVASRLKIISELLATLKEVAEDDDDLFIGQSSVEVFLLQNSLIEKGYEIPSGPTGFFGKETRDALIRFQKDHDIHPAIGYCGPLTRAALFGDNWVEEGSEIHH